MPVFMQNIFSPKVIAFKRHAIYTKTYWKENMFFPPAFVSADDCGVILLVETIIISNAAFTFQRCHEKCTESCAKLSAEKIKVK